MKSYFTWSTCRYFFQRMTEKNKNWFYFKTDNPAYSLVNNEIFPKSHDLPPLYVLLIPLPIEFQFFLFPSFLTSPPPPWVSFLENMEVWFLREPHNSSELLTDVKWLETLFPENKTHSPPHSFSLFTENPPMTYLCENKSNYHNHHSHKD